MKYLDFKPKLLKAAFGLINMDFLDFNTCNYDESRRNFVLLLCLSRPTYYAMLLAITVFHKRMSHWLHTLWFLRTRVSKLYLERHFFLMWCVQTWWWAIFKRNTVEHMDFMIKYMIFFVHIFDREIWHLGFYYRNIFCCIMRHSSYSYVFQFSYF